MHIMAIPCRGMGERMRSIQPDGNKLAIDVAGVSALQRHLKFASFWHFDDVVVSTLPEFGGWVRDEGKGMVLVEDSWPVQDVDGPALSMRCCLSMIPTLPEETLVTFVFSDTFIDPMYPNPEVSICHLDEGTHYDAIGAEMVVGTAVCAYMRDGRPWMNVNAVPEKLISRFPSKPKDEHPSLATVGVFTHTLRAWQNVLASADKDPSLGLFNGFSPLVHQGRTNYGMAPVQIDPSMWYDIGTEENYKRTVDHFKR